MTDDVTVTGLTLRLDRLEREARWWRLVASLSAAAAGLVVLWWFCGALVRSVSPASAAAPKVTEAEQFILRDARGRSRAVLAVSDTGPLLALQDEQEARRATLAIAAGRPTLTLHDENGKLRVLLVVTPHGPALGLLDENGKDRASVAVVASGGRKASILTLQDENGKGKVTLTAPDTSIDKPTLAVEDESGKSSSLIRASGLALMGEDAKTRAMLSIIDDVPALFLNDKLQRTRISLGAVPIKTGTRWSLNIADVDGRTLLAVP